MTHPEEAALLMRRATERTSILRRRVIGAIHGVSDYDTLHALAQTLNEHGYRVNTRDLVEAPSDSLIDNFDRAFPPPQPRPCPYCKGTKTQDGKVCPACSGSGENRCQGNRDHLD